MPSPVDGQTADTSKYPFIGDDDYLGSKYHKWLLAYEIGIITYSGSNAYSVTPGLAVGQSMTINTDQMPDRWVISILAEGAGGAASPFGVRIARITLGPGGGSGYILGANGKLKLPAQGMNYLTITNIAATALTLFGTVIAVGGHGIGDIDVG